jgi:hypothetical protein
VKLRTDIGVLLPIAFDAITVTLYGIKGPGKEKKSCLKYMNNPVPIVIVWKHIETCTEQYLAIGLS